MTNEIKSSAAKNPLDTGAAFKPLSTPPDKHLADAGEIVAPVLMDESLAQNIRRLVLTYAEHKVYISSIYSKGGEIPFDKLNKNQINKLMVKISRVQKAQSICDVEIIPNDEIVSRLAFYAAIKDAAKMNAPVIKFPNQKSAYTSANIWGLGDESL
jgi:hypothetical protein